MGNFITLSCPNCGGKLQLTEDIERFACLYCGREQIVQRGGGIVSIKPVTDKLDAVRQSINVSAQFSSRAADELSLQRIEKERRQAEAQAGIAMNKLYRQKVNGNNNFSLGVISLVISAVICRVTVASFVGLARSIFSGRSPDGLFLFMAMTMTGVTLGLGVLSIYSSRKRLKSIQQLEVTIQAQVAALRREEDKIRRRLNAS